MSVLQLTMLHQLKKPKTAERVEIHAEQCVNSGITGDVIEMGVGRTCRTSLRMRAVTAQAARNPANSLLAANAALTRRTNVEKRRRYHR